VIHIDCISAEHLGYSAIGLTVASNTDASAKYDTGGSSILPTLGMRN